MAGAEVTADIAIVVSPREWAERLHRFIADHGGARVRARVLDAREALDADYAVLVADDLTSFLTPRLVAELHRRGRRILGVYDPLEPWGAERLRELGVDDRVAADASAEEVLHAVETLGAGLDLDAELHALVEAPAPPSPPVQRGTVVAVGGPPGGVGSTEVALALAVAGAAGARTVLVDADEFVPSMAQRLGLPLHPNLRSAIDAVEHRAGTLAAALQAVPGSSLAVLTGLPTPRDWHELRPGEVTAVLDELQATAAVVVVDVSCGTEDLAGLSASGRFSTTRAVLAAADVVVGVCAATPVGVARLFGWAADVTLLAADAPLHVAVNRVTGGRFVRGEIRDELARTLQLATITDLPHDARVERAAWDGVVVPEGPFTRAVRGLAAAAVGSAAVATEAAR